MVTKARSGEFTPKNPKKYKGKYPILWRSSWELTVFNSFDLHPNVVEWASESVSIPYRHPFTSRFTMYIPDLLVKYVDKKGKMRVELIEIKPAKEALIERVNSKYDQASFIINRAKWKAAEAWCKRNKIKFRVLTEFDIYQGYK